ncbi:MAG: endonuclease/exonuclease/phosphatase family protein [Chitinophagaceae bacterium]|nr:endonuclease/exonuclease/phosphatase family protein [Chitinophagaceae bacterium]
MKIITWNCNMAFRKKAGVILKYKPDILVIQECEHTDKIKFPPGSPQPTGALWIGSNLHKGLGIFSFGKYQIQLHDNYSDKLKFVAPVLVTGGDFEFHLLAIWANNPTDKDGRYVTQVWKAIHYYEKLLSDANCILTGDFNSNTIWDKSHKTGSHSDVVNVLEGKKIFSTYHLFHKQKQGVEKHPTLYLYRHKDKFYHLDYCFASAGFANKLEMVQIGGFKKWCALSDHVPLIVTFGEML